MSRHVNDGNAVARHMHGYRRDRKLPEGHDRLLSVSPEAVRAQPRSASLYPLVGTIPVYDQEGEGSCTANMGSLQFKYLVAKQGGPAFEPSRQNLYKSVRRVEGTPLSEDSGAEIRDIMRALRKFGVCREDLDPYIDDGVSFTLPVTEHQAIDALEHQALFYYRCATLHAIKASILQGFPVGFGFTCFESLMSAPVAGTGLVPYPESGEESVGGHANTVIGYDDDKVIGSEKGAVLSRNSWGSGWGQKGDLWLPYRYFAEGLASDCWTLRLVELTEDPA